MIKMFLYAVVFTAICAFGISRGWHKSISNFGNKVEKPVSTIVHNIEKKVLKTYLGLLLL